MEKRNPCPSCYPAVVNDCETQCPQCRGVGGTDLLDGYMGYCGRCAGMGHVPPSEIRWREFITGLSRELDQSLHLNWMQKLEEQHQKDVEEYIRRQNSIPLSAL